MDLSCPCVTPDIVLRVGPGNGPVVGFAQFRWSRTLTLGFGSPYDTLEDGAVLYEKMENVSKYCGHRRYRVEMSVTNTYKASSSGSGNQRRVFEWHRTRSEAYGVTGAENNTNYHYTIVDVESGEVVAVYLDLLFKSLRKKGEPGSLTCENEKGRLVLFRGEGEMGQHWKIMLLLGSCGLMEKTLRRSRFYSLGHGAACGECFGRLFQPRCGGSY